VTGPHWLRVCLGLDCLGEQGAANFHGAEYLSYLCGDKWLCRLRNSKDIRLILCLCRGMEFRWFECCTRLSPPNTFHFISSSSFRRKRQRISCNHTTETFLLNFSAFKFHLSPYTFYQIVSGRQFELTEHGIVFI
jgi:hypothetical protein